MRNSRMKAAMYEHGIKQIELSMMLGISELEVSKIVTGRKEAGESLQAQISQALGVPVGELFVPSTTVPRASEGQQNSVASRP